MSRPSDAQDAFGDDGSVTSPALGPVEWLRWAWRQLTSMRTALLLLLALAVAAVPGSIIPQESADPNGVAQYQQANPELSKVVTALQGFTVYTSVWFSAIYLLLFISLIGCVVPRIGHHVKALRAAPPRTPARFERMPAHTSALLPGTTAAAALDAAERLLRRRRYRVVRYGSSVSAERGYLRETGNLLFHTALLGVLVSVFVGGGFTFTGQRVLSSGETFVNTRSNYDTFTPGRFFDEDALVGYSLTLDRLDVAYEQRNPAALGQPLDYTAHVTTRLPGRERQTHTIKVNEPLDLGGTQIYLLGNGYSATFTVRNADGSLAYSGTVPFQPQGANNTSLGVIKAPDAEDPAKGIGMVGFLYPTAVKNLDGTFRSIFPSLGSPLITLNVYEGDLGLDSGVARNVYELDTSTLTEVAGLDAKDGTKAIELTRGTTAELPNGGTIRLDGITRFAAFDIHHDPSQGFVAVFVGLAVLGLITSLLVPRRRMWVRVTEEADGVRAEYAALARGDDPGLDAAVADLETEHRGSPGAAAVEPARV